MFLLAVSFVDYKELGMKKYIDIIFEKTNLKEGVLCIEKFLASLYLNDSLSTKELATNLLIPIPIATSIKKEAIKCGLVCQNNGVSLTNEGIRFVEEELGYKGIDIKLLNHIIMDEVFCEKMIAELSEKSREIYDKRPIVDVTVDQAKGTVETAFKRAVLCLKSGSLIGKKVLCVGDDDLTSIAMGILLKYIGSEGNNTEICVFDIDERFLKFIEEIAQKYSMPIRCCQVDLREPLPINYANYFDAFFTDPPYTVSGLALFLSRGVFALKKTSGLNVFFSFGNKPIEETIDMQRNFSKMGLVISSILKDFNKYEGASLYGGLSQMIVLKTTEDLNPMITEQFKEDLYTYDFRKTKHSYICRKCKSEILLKKGETIEALKKDGCPRCRGTVFDQKKKLHIDTEIDLNRKKSLGTHVLIDFYECSSEVLDNIDLIKEYMIEAANVANATIVHKKFHKFSPYGVSGAIIIQESHFTIHTWPEYRYAAVDLFTCGSNLDLKKAMLFLKEKLHSEKLEFNNVLRGLLKNGKAVHI